MRSIKTIQLIARSDFKMLLLTLTKSKIAHAIMKINAKMAFGKHGLNVMAPASKVEFAEEMKMKKKKNVTVV